MSDNMVFDNQGNLMGWFDDDFKWISVDVTGAQDGNINPPSVPETNIFANNTGAEFAKIVDLLKRAAATNAATQAATAVFTPDPDILFHDNNILDTIGLTELNERGYINIDNPKYDEDFGYAEDRVLPTARARVEYAASQTTQAAVGDATTSAPVGDATTSAPVGNATTSAPVGDATASASGGNTTTPTTDLKMEDRIHPLFHKDLWIPDTWRFHEIDYKDLLPTFQLATLLLEEESMAGFLIGMLETYNHKRINYEPAQERIALNTQAIDEAKSFKAVVNPTQAQREILFMKIRDLAKKIVWVVAPMEVSGPLAKAEAVHLDDLSFYIQITIKDEYIYTVCKKISPRALGEPWQPGTDDDSARLRVQALLATTFCHELCHALYMVESFGVFIEPYYTDARISELGMEWTKRIYGGILMPVTQRLCSPYGIKHNRWPGDFDSWGHEYFIGRSLMSLKKWNRGPKWHTDYIVHMSWPEQLFTNEFWSNVDRYGVETFKLPKTLGIRKVVDERLYVGESPTAATHFEEGYDSEDSHASSESAGTRIVDRHMPRRHGDTKGRIRSHVDANRDAVDGSTIGQILSHVDQGGDVMDTGTNGWIYNLSDEDAIGQIFRHVYGDTNEQIFSHVDEETNNQIFNHVDVDTSGQIFSHVDEDTNNQVFSHVDEDTSGQIFRPVYGDPNGWIFSHVDEDAMDID